MKRSIVTLITIVAAAGIFSQTSAFGADTDQNNRGKKSSFLQKLRGSKAKGTKVTSSKTGETLGTVQEIIIDPTSGKVEFVMVGSGGVAGVGEKLHPVPWEAITVKSDKDFTVNQDKQKFESSPTVTNDQAASETPAEVIAIYEFYEVPAPASASGGTGSSTSGTQQGQSSQQQQNQQDRQRQQQQDPNKK